MRDERGEGRGPKKEQATLQDETNAASSATVRSDRSEGGLDSGTAAAAPISAAAPTEPTAPITSQSTAPVIEVPLTKSVPAPPLDTTEFEEFEQIEYLIHQSTLGNHFLFDNADVARILRLPHDKEAFSNEANRTKVQALLSNLLDCQALKDKRAYLARLPKEDFELLVRAYFQLVENTILAHAEGRH